MSQKIRNKQKQTTKESKVQKHTVRILKTPKDLKDTSQFPSECMTHNKC